MDRKNLEGLIGSILKPRNFRKKASTWYRQGAAALHVINLQKSSWGPQFYLNLSLVPTGMEIEGLPSPKENQCPIRVRVGALMPENMKAHTERLLDLEDTTLSDGEREAGLEKIFLANVIPFFDQIESVGFKISLNQPLLANRVNWDAKQFLGMVD